MTTYANKDVIRGWAEVIWNDGNVAVSDRYITDTFFNHNLVDLPRVRGREEHDAWVTRSRDQLDGWHVTLDDLVAEGDRVASRWTIRGTDKQTKQPTTSPGTHFYRFEGGKIAEMWTSIDRAARS